MLVGARLEIGGIGGENVGELIVIFFRRSVVDGENILIEGFIDTSEAGIGGEIFEGGLSEGEAIVAIKISVKLVDVELVISVGGLVGIGRSVGIARVGLLAANMKAFASMASSGGSIGLLLVGVGKVGALPFFSEDLFELGAVVSGAGLQVVGNIEGGARKHLSHLLGGWEEILFFDGAHEFFVGGILDFDLVAIFIEAIEWFPVDIDAAAELFLGEGTFPVVRIHEIG